MMRQEERQQILKDMRSGYRQAEFLQQRLQVFLRALLTVEAHLVMQRVASSTEFLGGAVVGFRFSHPLLRQLFHIPPATKIAGRRGHPSVGGRMAPPSYVSIFVAGG